MLICSIKIPKIIKLLCSNFLLLNVGFDIYTIKLLKNNHKLFYQHINTANDPFKFLLFFIFIIYVFTDGL